jgi:hypothetical protein
MQLQSLKHLLSVVQAVAAPQTIYLLGSGCLLPAHPELGEPGQPLALTQDGDFLIEPVNDSLAGMLQEAVGKEAIFMEHFGYYADILRPTLAEALPAGWESRLHPVAGYDNVFALDAYDLALVKLMVGRQKDLDLLRALLKLGILEPARLRAHYQQTPLGENEAATAGRNLTLLLREIGTP